ncbi:SET domain-containing protein-lysine N-methyltransferase [Paraburkholderia sp. CNPSo 3274]|uniref:SET domain-containing protein n=1 Tax=Paraburkholderia sp. CNPSo 3274 TaxID=2940932 RepID=UPI0020B71B4E|nr:SET domain-containing protein-lysine N-methyltransferase [Paraburkholderia sp. CNPSo 3274]MCP3713640.1 SET domain-containing protein-lysine N-methyltransferase [Paraburkholderia sp. CNPSo 3274]
MKRVTVRQSIIHGKGVFALRPLVAGERIFEYKGFVTTWTEAARFHRWREEAGHTFLFGLSDGRVIDGARGGNGARWLNHACVANCEAIEEGERVFIDAARDIAPGEELFIDYALEVAPETDQATLEGYACRCGDNHCRGTMLSLA